MPIRDAEARHLDEILELNELVVPAVNSLTMDRMHWFLDSAHWFRVIEEAGTVSAFLIGFFDGSDYESSNYRWFAARYPRFAYVDRIAVLPSARRAGHANRLYEDFIAGMPGDVPALSCEVNIRPANPGSLRFHERLGFGEVGRQETDNGEKEVALLLREL